ncbi:MAG: EAL domain-containing protein [Spirochaetales bacterium]|nr:EAL domain-containing protein [Spirochaetales bacterium]
MNCYNCTLTGRIATEGLKIVYLQPDIAPSALTLHHFLTEKDVAHTLERSLVKVTTIDPESLIELLYTKLNLSVEEKNSLRILILNEAEELSIETLEQFKSLNRWYQIFKAHDLLSIVEKKSITAQFQPIIRLDDWSIYGYECLMRGIADDGRVIPPGTLFEQAVELDLTFNLDRVTRETIIRLAANNNTPGYLFINFLPNSIYDPETCLRTTMRVVDEMGIDHSRLVFEVVESQSFQDPERLIAILDYYRSKGVRTALDDVGSGYSSLNILAQLRPDIMKIDRELVQNIHSDPFKQSIFRALSSIANDLSIMLLAEGVETRAELDWVRENGVHLVQGYYFSKPMDLPSFEMPA